MARKRKKRRRRNPGLTPAAFLNPRRRGGKRRRHNPRRGSRRRRRNPFGSSPRGIVGMVTQGSVDALGIVTGKIASRAIPALVGINQTGITGVAIQAASAVAAGFLGSKLNRNFGRMVLAGGLAGILEGYAKAANIPVISPALGDEYDAVMGTYVTDGGAGDVERFGLYAGMSGDATGGDGEDISDSVGILPG